MSSNHVTVTFKKSGIILLAFLGIVSFGFVPILLWFFSLRHTPTHITPNGIDLRSGRSVKWSDYSRTDGQRVLAGGVHITEVLTFWFDQQKVIIAPMYLQPADEAVAAIRSNIEACRSRTSGEIA